MYDKADANGGRGKKPHGNAGRGPRGQRARYLFCRWQTTLCVGDHATRHPLTLPLAQGVTTTLRGLPARAADTYECLTHGCIAVKGGGTTLDDHTYTGVQSRGREQEDAGPGIRGKGMASGNEQSKGLVTHGAESEASVTTGVKARGHKAREEREPHVGKEGLDGRGTSTTGVGIRGREREQHGTCEHVPEDSAIWAIPHYVTCALRKRAVAKVQAREAQAT